VVFFDALVTPEVLALAGRAQRIGVGKRAGKKSVSQEVIHRVMVRAARRGKRVVRLKCGDPTVLGRGGEEALALAAAGVPFELVPGLSSAIAAPELAGIPVTHRGISSGFAVVSGHSKEAFEASVAGLAPHALTLVVLMGLGRRSEIADALVARGWRADTPAAVVWASSHAEESRWRGTLAELSLAPESEQPGTLVIGDVVRVSEMLGGVAAAPGKVREAV
jgi:uroporphyrin-III C-methyltransferase/precorrin-2 dehydrogenase/sirohydrochlorin ferrochelatase